MTEKDKILTVENLSVIFSDSGASKRVIKDISFTLHKGEILGIVGESGSGKSVTVMTIMGLIDSPPLIENTGSIIYKDLDLLTLKNRDYRKIRGKEISYIFQEPMTALNPVFTIGDQLTETIREHNRGMSKKDAIKKSISLLEEVNIPDPVQRMKNYPHELSGGMRQRAMIATALSCNPKILLADEPTTALDVTIQAQILSLLKDLVKKRDMSLIFITHDLGVIAEIADNVLVMKDGEIVERGGVVDIFHKPTHPYTIDLLSYIGGREL
ncbi:MAG: ABC transporter ATP-binding protein [Deltaproteobacteria bacterium]|nr:ABC transporter ATP-binding protein [Deltaproteobacteria bacterium]